MCRSRTNSPRRSEAGSRQDRPFSDPEQLPTPRGTPPPWPNPSSVSSAPPAAPSPPKWAGRCEACGDWNTIAEEAVDAATRPRRQGRARPLGRVRRRSPAPPHRRRAPATGIAELDRVLGGGLVPASAVLVGGDPGIGKSTLLLQAAARAGRAPGGRCCTSPARNRSSRCGCAPAGWGSPTRRSELAAAINLRDIAATPGAERRRGAGGDRFDPDHVARHASTAPPAPSPRCAPPRSS